MLINTFHRRKNVAKTIFEIYWLDVVCAYLENRQAWNIINLHNEDQK